MTEVFCVKPVKIRNEKNDYSDCGKHCNPLVFFRMFDDVSCKNTDCKRKQQIAEKTVRKIQSAFFEHIVLERQGKRVKVAGVQIYDIRIYPEKDKRKKRNDD